MTLELPWAKFLNVLRSYKRYSTECCCKYNTDVWACPPCLISSETLNRLQAGLIYLPLISPCLHVSGLSGWKWEDISTQIWAIVLTERIRDHTWRSVSFVSGSLRRDGRSAWVIRVIRATALPNVGFSSTFGRNRKEEIGFSATVRSNTENICSSCVYLCVCWGGGGGVGSGVGGPVCEIVTHYVHALTWNMTSFRINTTAFGKIKL